ncbi:uncharacterized protein LOC101854233 isoform X2 [Aplysia californica]|nr:uncharacterized protein LOC101854233 isoform X2 [Aplysia californica]
MKECRISFAIPDEIEKALFKICFRKATLKVKNCPAKVIFQEHTPSGTNDLKTVQCPASKYVYSSSGYSSEMCLNHGHSLDVVFSSDNFCSIEGFADVSTKSFGQISLSSSDSCPRGYKYRRDTRGTVFSYHGAKMPVPARFCNGTLWSYSYSRSEDFCYFFRYANFQRGGASLHILDQSGNEHRIYGYYNQPKINSEYCIPVGKGGKASKVDVYIQKACSSTYDCAPHNAQHAFVFGYEFREVEKAEPEAVEEEDDDTVKIIIIVASVLAVFLLCCCCLCCCCSRKDSSDSTNATAAATEQLTTGSPAGESSMPVFVHPTQSISTNGQGQAIYQTTDLSAPPPAWSTLQGPSSPSHFPSASAGPDLNRYPSAPPMEESQPFVDQTSGHEDSEKPPPDYNSLFPDHS